MLRYFHTFLALLLFSSLGIHTAWAQNNTGSLSGGLQMFSQYYMESEEIDAVVPPEILGFNGYFNLLYQKGNFRAGVRYEAYESALLGYPSAMDGHGIANRFAAYTLDNLEVTVGNFYEQFGNGLLLRAQEERMVGIDNAFDGLSVRYNFGNIARVKGLVGRQRIGFDYSDGIVRGFDGEIYLDQLFASKEEDAAPLPFSLALGGSFVSRYERYDGLLDYIGENSDAYAGRFNFVAGKFSLSGEYAHKVGDPSRINDYITKEGTATLLNAGYTTKGFAVNFTARRVDNIDFRTNRTAIDNDLMLNWVTANTRQHTYQLLSLYPYASQVMGEWGLQGDLIYTVPRGSKLGGKYGMTISLNYSLAYDLDTLGLTDERGYESEFFKFGENKYFQDFNIEINKKWSRKLRTNLLFARIDYDKDVIEGRTGYGIVTSNTVVLDVLYKINRKMSVRTELQHLATSQDQGSWAFALVEIGLRPNWFFFASDEVNYNGISVGVPTHYYNVGASYVKGANQFMLSYGRQRFGLICVGGICRLVPPSSGINFTISSTF